MKDMTEVQQGDTAEEIYYVPHESRWPFFFAMGLFFLGLGIVQLLHDNFRWGTVLFSIGALSMSSVLFFWFRDVIIENLQAKHGPKSDKSFRWGMAWFIFSESCFFGVFFGALFYVRTIVVPWLSGDYGGVASKLSHLMNYPDFQNVWPLLKNPDPTLLGPGEIVGVWGIPAINTLLLLTSGITLTIGHWALKRGKQGSLCFWLLMTILLGSTFLYLQFTEYMQAIYVHGLTFSTGIYASTFFMLTGFHGAHVTVGTIMLITMLVRSWRGHFTEENHFAFEATTWYWHFVDVVWILLFIFVYWL